MDEYTTLDAELDLDWCDTIEDVQEVLIPYLRDQRNTWKVKIRDIIQKTNLSIEKFAKLCEVSVPTVRKWLNGSLPHRNMCIQIGIAAGYNREEIDSFLQRYGKTYRLYERTLIDGVYLFLLQSNNRELPYKEILREAEDLLKYVKNHLGEAETILSEEYPTLYFAERIAKLKERDELMAFIKTHASLLNKTSPLLCNYICDHLSQVIKSEHLEDAAFNRFAIENGWSSSLRHCIYDIQNGHWIPVRHKVISLGLHLNMDVDEINHMLELAKMEPLYAKDPVEAVVKWAVRTAKRCDRGDDADHQDSLCDYVKNVLIQLGLAEEDNYLISDLYQERCCLVVLEDGQIRGYPLDTRHEWSIGRYGQKFPNNPDISFASPIVSHEHGRFLKKEDNWFYVNYHKNRNGTFYKGVMMPKSRSGANVEQRLKNGDVLRIDNADLNHSSGVLMLFITGTFKGTWTTYPLTKQTTVIGHDDSRNIIEPLRHIAAKHAQISFVDGSYYLSDCNGAGTLLNGKPVQGSVLLRERDHISLSDEYDCNYFFLGDKLLYAKHN